jgi:hypothetical protein
MSSSISIKNLPYNIENNKTAQLAFLSKLIGLKPELLIHAGQKEVDAICATILYRHLPQAQRNYAMQLIRSVSHRPLQGKLIENVLLTTFVNSQWGIWSLTNKELEADRAFHDFLDRYASYLGYSASVMGVKDFFDSVRKSKKMSKGGMVMLVIWGAVAFNKTELDKVNKEIGNRTIQITTGFH